MSIVDARIGLPDRPLFLHFRGNAKDSIKVNSFGKQALTTFGRRAAAILLLGLSAPIVAQSLTDLVEIHFTGDIDNALPGNATDVFSGDDAILNFDLNTATATSNQDLGPLPQAGIDAIHRSGDGCGAAIYSVDTTTTVSGIAVRPADVFDATGSKLLDAEVAGIPAGINIDAVSRDASSCDLLLSIDTNATLDGTAFRPDDVIAWSSAAGFSLYQATGFNANIDALHFLSADRMLFSLDVGTTLTGVDLMDEEVFEVSFAGGGVQLLAFEPGMFNDAWQGADLNALWALPAPLVGDVHWQFSSVAALENTGSIDINLVRSGGSAGAISIDWSTFNGTAVDGIDFAAASGSASMGDGISSAIVTITLLDDVELEGNEFFSVAIIGTTGGAIVSNPSQVVVTVLDDEDYIFSDGLEN